MKIEDNPMCDKGEIMLELDVTIELLIFYSFIVGKDQEFKGRGRIIFFLIKEKMISCHASQAKIVKSPLKQA